MAHFFVNIGMNIGIMPITGTTLPFLSYGGTHMLTVYAALGILMGMRRYSRHTHPDDAEKEFLRTEIKIWTLSIKISEK